MSNRNKIKSKRKAKKNNRLRNSRKRAAAMVS